ncbi:unnamed protein product [Rotaria sp. Silwood2]|nr:unnamed protein product [Rotaria sp. Silwood2]
MINNLPTKDIAFNKSNTCRFDNELFRYLIVLRNEIQFDTYEEEEYRTSWTDSVAESNRLFKRIFEELKSYLYTEWQSIEHIQIKINQMIRPTSETI